MDDQPDQSDLYLPMSPSWRERLRRWWWLLPLVALIPLAGCLLGWAVDSGLLAEVIGSATPTLSPTRVVAPLPPTSTATDWPTSTATAWPTATATATPTPIPGWALSVQASRDYLGPMADWTEIQITIDHQGEPVTATLGIGMSRGLQHWSGDMAEGTWRGMVGTANLSCRLFRETAAPPPGGITLTLDGPLTTVLTLTLPLDATPVQSQWEWTAEE